MICPDCARARPPEEPCPWCEIGFAIWRDGLSAGLKSGATSADIRVRRERRNLRIWWALAVALWFVSPLPTDPDEYEYYGQYERYRDRERAREQAYEQGYVEACFAMETAMGADPRP